MLYITSGEEQKAFLAFADSLISLLSQKQYGALLQTVDKSRMTEKEIVLALKYLDATCPAVSIDDPTQDVNKETSIECFRLYDGSGYHMDYDLTTDGEFNDLTVQLSFLKRENGYFVVLDRIRPL